MTRGILRKVFALLLLHTLWPSIGLAQSPKAGVVTTLHGVATVARLAAPPEIPLGFKDDVFFRDRITTRENSVVRLLLGGKALVTVRELSVLTISEDPEKATVDLQAGKIALAVARQRLRPGEQIEIRTPNAIAGVRGTVVIVEVLRATAQVTPAAVAAVTTFYVLSGVLNIFVAGQQFTVGALQSLSIAGNVAGQIQPVTPAAAQQLKQDYTPPTQHGDSPSEAQQAVVSQQQAQLTALVAAIAPEQVAPTAAIATTGPPSSDQPSTSEVGVQEVAAASQVAAPVVPMGPYYLVQDSHLALPAGTPLASFTSGSDPATVSQRNTISGRGTSSSPVLLDGLSGRPAAPLVQATGSNISISGDSEGPVLEFRDSALQNMPPVPLVGVTGPTTVTTTTFLTLNNSDMTISRPLLESTNATINASGPLFRITNGSTATSTAGPAIKIIGGSVTADALVITDGTGNDLTVAGPALDLSSGASLTLRTLGEDVPHTHLDDFILNLSANQPAILMSNSTLTLTGVGESLIDFPDDDPVTTEPGVALIANNSTINLKGSLLELEAVNSTATSALVQLNTATVNQSGTTDALLSVDPDGGAVTMQGPMLTATASTITTSGPVLHLQDGSLTSNTTQPFVSINPSTVTSSDNFILLSNSFSLSLKGSLLDSTDTNFTNTSNLRSFFPIVDGASLTTSGTSAPLLKFTGTAAGLSKVTAARNFLPMARTTSGSPAPSMSLSGPLLDATKTDFKTGDPTSSVTGNTLTFLFVGDGSTLTSTSSLALMSFNNSSVDTAGNILTLRRSTSTSVPSKLTLSGPLFSATNSSTFNTSSLGFGSIATSPGACCSGFSISQGAQLSSTTSSALIQLSNSTFSAGPDAQSGGSFFSLRDNQPISGELVAPASVSLAGSLLSATDRPTAGDSTIKALFSLLSVVRSSLTSSSPTALIQLIGTTGVGTGMTTVNLGGTDPFTGLTTFGRVLFVRSSDVSGTPASAASVSLTGNGPLLVATNSSLTMTADVISVQNGATFTSTTSAPLIQLNGASLTAGTGSINADLLEVIGTGGLEGTNFASASLKGPLLSAGSTLDLTGGLAGIFSGGQVTVSGSTDPFVSITGGTHAIATNSGTAMLRLFGRSSATANEVADGVTLNLGTDEPLKHSNPTGFPASLLQATDATVSAQKGLILDTALLQATAPLINLLKGSGAGSQVTFTGTDPNSGALDLSIKAKLTSVGPIARLDGSTMTVNNGAAVKVGGGSYLKVIGDLIHLLNGSTLTLSNGPALNVTGSSVVNISGALVAYNGGSNTVNITNTLCSPCTSVSGIPVTGGGTISIGPNPLKSLGTGSLNVVLSNPTLSTGGTAVLVVTPGSKVTIGAP